MEESEQTLSMSDSKKINISLASFIVVMIIQIGSLFYYAASLSKDVQANRKTQEKFAEMLETLQNQNNHSNQELKLIDQQLKITSKLANATSQEQTKISEFVFTVGRLERDVVDIKKSMKKIKEQNSDAKLDMKVQVSEIKTTLNMIQQQLSYQFTNPYQGKPKLLKK